MIIPWLIWMLVVFCASMAVAAVLTHVIVNRWWKNRDEVDDWNRAVELFTSLFRKDPPA